MSKTGRISRLRRHVGRSAVVIGACAALAHPAQAAQPTFENRTPTGFSITDSTTKTDFVEATNVTVRADLNQAVTPTYPVIGHFHNLETSKALNGADIDGLRADIAVGDGNVVHMAWITSTIEGTVSTPVYYVNYSRSNNNGVSFSTPVSISGTLRFDLLTADGGGASFSTLDLEIDSRGNPRVVYAFDSSPDGRTAAFNSEPDNIYLNYSQNGGASWLPGNQAIIVNDTTSTGNTEGRSSAFPRLAIDERDNIYVTYVRGVSAAADDIMLARVDRSTSPYTMVSVSGATGGVRLTEDTERQTGPDLVVGTGDVLHVLYFQDDATPATSRIEHKTLLADDWSDVSAFGWAQGAAGAAVDLFDPTPAGNPALNTIARFVFPTALVDTISTPDRIYAFYKFGDATFESVAYNYYDYDHAKAGAGNWNTAQASTVWSTAASPIFSSGDLQTNIELEWELVDRVSAILDDRRPDKGEIHIAFSAGYSNTTAGAPGEQDIYYGFFNGNTWTLPERVADDDAGIIDGIAAADVFLQAPVLSKRRNDDNVYLTFVGGSAEGYGVDNTFDANQHAYFKVLGRVVTSEDESVPVGAYQYNLTYSPVLPHDATTDIENNAVYVHVADNGDGTGLGATGRQSDGFLAGDWESVGGTSLQDNDKFFEGLVNEDAASDHEWGDDNDKVGLLVKLNILGSDSSQNLQLITASTASDAGTGQGARTVRVATTPQVSLAIGDFFQLGAEIDIVDANRAPFLAISQPDGILDSANTSYTIRYDLTDVDDDFGSGLQASLYFAESGGLSNVQDIRIFGTLIADENDDSSVNANGTDDFLEGLIQFYTWDDPPEALKNLLFASIFQVPDGDYFIYLVADDGKNPPAYAVSPGTITLRHKPLVQFVDPVGLETVDTGIRTGASANPYDFDFFVRDFDDQGSSQVALFYSAVSGLNSISVSGTYPTQRFVLGKSVSGTRGVFIEGTDTLNTADVEFTWDVTDSVFVAGDSSIVAQGQYYLYVIASDGDFVTVGQSPGQLTVKHSPTLTFYDPPKDTHRRINSGSQPVYSLQWQKGPGDADFDDNATIDLYYTTDNPLSVNYEGNPDSLLSDIDTHIIETGRSEDSDAGASDMYIWNFRNAANVPIDGEQIWIYGLIRDSRGNENVELGGSLTIEHDPRMVLLSSDLDDLASFEQNDLLRLRWDDYLIDDGSGTDDAHVRLYASTQVAGFFTTIADLEGDVGSGSTYLVNSTDGTLAGHIPIRESDDNFFDWNTRLFGPAGSYLIYSAISMDATFGDNTLSTFDVSTSSLTIAGTATPPNVGFSPSDAVVAIGDTLTLDVMVQHPSNLNLIQIVIDLNTSDFTVLDQGSPGVVPFVDLDNVFSGSTPIENRVVGNQLRFAKSSFVGELIGTTSEPVALARVQLIARETLTGAPSVAFSNFDTGTVFGLVGQGEPLDFNDGLTLSDADLTRLSRGSITATIELEGHTAPLGSGDHSSLLDIHLRLPGSTIDIDDAKFFAANDADLSTTDTLEVQTDAAGALTLVSVPAGRYVLTIKDTSHVSGRTDTIMIRNGETIDIVSTISSTLDVLGFFGSDLRGDATSLLASSGTQLIAGDVSEDNEINEDDVNLIIAAWGTNAALPSFEQADINNDDIVGASDLTVTTSNFGNSEGFGAPPVYKRSGAVRNDKAQLDLRVIGGPPRGALRPGDLLGVEITAAGLGQLAGYEFELGFDDTRLQPLAERTERGDIFDENPHGSVFQTRIEGERLFVMGSRVGKDWSATGDGRLLRLWFEVLQESPNLADGLQLGEGVLLDPGYVQQPVSWERSLAELLLPRETMLQPNYPNPFNPTTVLPFALDRSQDVRLEIYNVLGQRIRTLVEGPMEAGFHTLIWNGRDDVGRSMAAGLYFSLLETESVRQTRKMSLLK